MNLDYFQDPSHGWIAAPLSLLRNWAFFPSRYSYQDASFAYLEEDCDAARFMAEAAARGVAVTLTEHHTNTDHPIRQLPRFKETA